MTVVENNETIMAVIKPKQRRKGNREKLMNAALDLLAEDQGGLSGISLRQITKKCGLSPPAFYSHFISVEELGLALVKFVGSTLREVLKSVPDVGSEEDVVAASVQAGFDYIRKNEAQFVLITRERAGSSAQIRAAIRKEVREVVEDRVRDFHARGLFMQFDIEQKRALISAMIALGLNLIPDYLDLSRQSPEQGEALLLEFRNQLQLLLLSAAPPAQP